MRCHFDILERILVDQNGVEVCDLDDAVAQARRAIAELRRDAEQNAGRDAASQVPFSADLFLLVRAESDRFICVIPLDDEHDGH